MGTEQSPCVARHLWHAGDCRVCLRPGNVQAPWEVRAAQLPEPAKLDTAEDRGPNLVDSLRRTVDAKIQATWQKVRREKRAWRTATKKLKCGDVIIFGESEGKGAEATPSPVRTRKGEDGYQNYPSYFITDLPSFLLDHKF
ncbi:ureidoglycolate lyase [Striga asiatica]|uniref:Ureidoglycolate lyase n=1 Tax=Striga asiatica TaxID=4170 RepID=A0A5A7PKP5_STRAF|nr:ureidoglycolate lyase [Striga asiatica]